MTSIAYAMGQGGGAAAQGGAGGFSSFIPLILMFVIFYFLLIRPQQKKQKEHQELLRGLKTGDKVVTGSGMYGTIAALDEKIVLLQVDPKARIKVSRQSISALSDDELSI